MRHEPAIRQGTSADAECLAALAIQVWLHTYAAEGIREAIARYVLYELTAEKFARILADTASPLLVAEVNQHLVGYALIKFGAQGPSTSSVTEVASLYVQEHFARRGIGSALVRAAQNEALRRVGSPSVWLTVNARNANAIAFYRRLGFAYRGVSYFDLGGEKHENHVLVSTSGA